MAQGYESGLTMRGLLVQAPMMPFFIVSIQTAPSSLFNISLVFTYFTHKIRSFPESLVRKIALIQSEQQNGKTIFFLLGMPF